MRLRNPCRPLAGAAVICLWLALPSAAQAATAYIVDEVRVPLRETPCGNCRIVHRGLKSGTRMEVSESRDGWSRVTTAGGLEGWLPSQYLIDRPIARDRLDALSREVETLRGENDTLRGRATALGEEAEQLRGEIQSLTATKETLGSELDEIRDLSGDTLQLHAQNQELLKHNKILQSEVDVLQARLEQLERNELQRWFFYGGLLVALGALLSALLPRLKPKRRGYSEWR